MRMLRRAIRHNHLRKTQAVENRAHLAAVCVRDCGDDKAFAAVERW